MRTHAGSRHGDNGSTGSGTYGAGCTRGHADSPHALVREREPAKNPQREAGPAVSVSVPV